MKARARANDVETSHEAAATIDLESDAPRVLRFLVGGFDRRPFTHATAVTLIHGGSTLEGKPISESGIRSRVKELRDSGYIEWMQTEDGEPIHADIDGRRSRLMRVTERGKDTILKGHEVHLVRGAQPHLKFTINPWDEDGEYLGRRVASVIAQHFGKAKAKVTVIVEGVE